MHTAPSNDNQHLDSNSGETVSDTAGTDLNADQDGRNKEWEDRARVNLEEVPDGTKTMVERDFEPEQPNKNESKKRDPAY